jgi:hypothetical protein
VDLLAGAALVTAILLPVNSTATWLNATYTATLADVVAGVWILKVTLAAIAVSAWLLHRGGPDTVQSGENGITLDNRSAALLAAVIVLGLGLRLYRLDSELWLDEILLLGRYIPLEFRQLVSTYDSQNHQPLYSLMSRLSFLAAGGSDWSIRVPAVLLGVASLGATWWFARRVTSAAEAMLAALLLAVSYHHVWFSQNARGYTTMLLFALLGSGVFIRLCEGKGHTRRLAWGYAVLVALATYTHLTAALIAVGHALALMFTTRWTSTEGRRRAVWPVTALALSALVTIFLYSLMLPQVVREVSKPTMEGVEVAWTGIGWMLRESLRVLSTGVPGGLVTVLVAVSVLGVGVVSYWRQSRIATLVMFLPIAVTLVTIVATRHNLWPRFFFFGAGFFVLAALRGGFVLVHWLIRWHPQRVAVAGACAVALLSLVTVPTAWLPKQQFRAAYEFIEQERRPGDVVIALDAASEVYQLRGWTTDWRLTRDVSAVDEAERTAPRTWIVFTLPARLQALEPEMFQRFASSTYQVVRIFPATVGGGEIHVLRHDSTTAHD